MVKLIGKTSGGVAAAALAAGAVLAFAPGAYAGTTTGTATCDIPENVRDYMGGKAQVTGPQPYTVTGPASGAAGSEIELNIDLGASPAGSPMAVPVKMVPTIEFKASGASTSTISGTAPVIQMTLPDKGKGGIDLPAFKLKVKIPADAKPGKLDLTPTKLTLDVDATVMKLNIPCTTTGASVVYSVNVTAAGSSTTTSGGSSTTTSGGSSTTSSGGTSAAAGSSTTTGDSLPKTGPLDDALSMGLVGGTVGLLGIGAVLVATRKVRNSRNAAA